MKKLLLTTAALLALAAPANAAIIADLGVNPTSAQGAFNSAPGGGSFEDQFTFQLVGGPMFFTIASVTNVFPQPTDFITNFEAAVWSVGADGIVNNGDDVAVVGPIAATPCPITPNCQGVAGSGLLDPGAYYLEFTGIGGGTSGYGGNLATFQVPGPLVGAGLPGLILGCLALVGIARRRRQTT